MAAQILEAIWEVNDGLWAMIEPVLVEFWPRKRTVPPSACWGGCLNGIIYRLPMEQAAPSVRAVTCPCAVVGFPSWGAAQMNGFVLVYDAWNRLAAVRDDADFVQKWRYDGWNPGS